MNRENNNFDSKENLGHGIKGDTRMNTDLKNENKKKNSEITDNRNNKDELL